MTPFDAVYFCRDEDLLIEAAGDLPLLAPRGAVRAAGSDGVIDPSTPWVLSSATNDFAAQGVEAGQVVILAGPRGPKPFPTATDIFGGTDSTSLYGGEPFVIDVPDAAPTLRRAGLPSAVGLPPSRGEAIAAIKFVVPDFLPKIRAATDFVRRQLDYALDADLTDAEDLRKLTVYAVLADLYLAATRSLGDDKDAFAANYRRYQAMYEATLAALKARSRSGYQVDTIPVCPQDT